MMYYRHHRDIHAFFTKTTHIIKAFLRKNRAWVWPAFSPGLLTTESVFNLKQKTQWQL